MQKNKIPQNGVEALHLLLMSMCEENFLSLPRTKVDDDIIITFPGGGQMDTRIVRLSYDVLESRIELHTSMACATGLIHKEHANFIMGVSFEKTNVRDHKKGQLYRQEITLKHDGLLSLVLGSRWDMVAILCHYFELLERLPSLHVWDADLVASRKAFASVITNDAIDAHDKGAADT